VVFKQLLQAGAVDVVQIDTCRVGGVGENIAILLLAAKFGVPVCPHAGGVGLCELVQHLAMADYVAISGTFGGRVLSTSTTCTSTSTTRFGSCVAATSRRGRRASRPACGTRPSPSIDTPTDRCGRRSHPDRRARLVPAELPLCGG
jgi:Enolase C-terminal domain-like